MKLIETILQKMSSISIPQRKFLVTVLATIPLLRGTMIFRNLSRYSDLHEKPYARQFQKSVDVADCNYLALMSYLPANTIKIAARACPVISKSGKQTYGLEMFYHGCHDRAERGIEFSELAVDDTRIWSTGNYMKHCKPEMLTEPNQSLAGITVEHQWLMLSN